MSYSRLFLFRIFSELDIDTVVIKLILTLSSLRENFVSWHSVSNAAGLKCTGWPSKSSNSLSGSWESDILKRRKGVDQALKLRDVNTIQYKHWILNPLEVLIILRQFHELDYDVSFVSYFTQFCTYELKKLTVWVSFYQDSLTN